VSRPSSSSWRAPRLVRRTWSMPRFFAVARSHAPRGSGVRRERAGAGRELSDVPDLRGDAPRSCDALVRDRRDLAPSAGAPTHDRWAVVCPFDPLPEYRRGARRAGEDVRHPRWDVGRMREGVPQDRSDAGQQRDDVGLVARSRERLRYARNGQKNEEGLVARDVTGHPVAAARRRHRLTDHGCAIGLESSADGQIRDALRPRRSAITPQ
jgi:hypothetical protein